LVGNPTAQISPPKQALSGCHGPQTSGFLLLQNDVVPSQLAWAVRFSARGVPAAVVAQRYSVFWALPHAVPALA
jgi:hypothetical protein